LGWVGLGWVGLVGIYPLAVGRRVLGDGPMLSEDVRRDDIIALVLVDNSKVPNSGAGLAVKGSSERRHNQLASRDQGKRGLEEVWGVAVANLAKEVSPGPGECAGDAVGDDSRVRRRLRPEPECRSVGAEPQSNHVVGW